MNTKNLSEERHVFHPKPALLPEGANQYLLEIPGQGPQGDTWRQLNDSKKDQFMEYYFQKLVTSIPNVCLFVCTSLKCYTSIWETHDNSQGDV